MVRGGGAAGGARGSHRGSRGSRGSSGESTDKDWMDEEFQNPLGTKSRSDGSEPGTPGSRHSQRIAELGESHDDLSEEEFQKIEAVFNQLDHNADGYVSRDELAVAMRQAEPSITDGQIDRVMKALDTDGSGSISSTEFRAREETKLKKMKSIYAEMVETFEQMDVCRSMCAYLFFTTIYFVVIFMQLKIRHSFDVEDGLKDALSGMKSQGGVTFDSVTDPTQFWEWMMTALVPSVYKAKQYNGATMNPYEKNYIASFNRVVGGMFMLQERRLRANAGNRYSKFYPVEYLDEYDNQPFGPLYVECTDDSTKECTEPTFDKNLALLENSGIEGITDICDTFENVPLREEFCDGICLSTHDQTRSWDSSNAQCVTCRAMCISHFEEEDQPESTEGSLARICSSCIDYYEADGADVLLGIYAPLGDLHFYTSRPEAGRCEEYRSRCSQVLCDSCIDFGPLPLRLNAPVAFNVDSPLCFTKLPICDDYLHSQRQLTCAHTILPEIGGCEPRSIGQGTCDLGCNTYACEWDRGDCCELNLEERDMVPCAASWNGTSMSWTQGDSAIGDGSCHEECWNEFCLQDGGDCSFCTEQCFRPAVATTAGCNACREDCRGSACQEVCPGHSACTGECSVCEMERSCFSEDVLRGGVAPHMTVPESRVALVQSLPHCLPQHIGNGKCDFECFTDGCSFDDGDCGTCPPECVLRQGDGICDPECYDACPREIEDCPDCSDGCTPFEVGDGTCNPECYNPLCSFDRGDCYYCGAECVRKMGDGHCDAECYIGACELDGGDCNVCNADTGCLNSLVNNGVCDKQCFNFECDFDGQDCYHCDSRPECSDRFVGDGICDYDCYHEDCAWDGGDCETVCKQSEFGICKAYMTLDDTCQRECYYEECGWDGDMTFISDAEGWGPRTGDGPCEPECSKDCQLHQIGDRTCDRACFEEACSYDGGDCDVCATGCPWSWVHDGQCDPECFVESCFFDSDPSDINGAIGDCRSDTACAVGCSPFMLGDGNCDSNCTSAACGFDGGDCGQFCDVSQNCPIGWVNNGACDVACFEATSCERDGRDCNFSPRCSRGCVDYVMLANARCEPACNTTECGYDYGDCGVDVPETFTGQSCFPGYVFDCSVECVRVTGIRDGICNSAEAVAANFSIVGNFNCDAFYWDFGDCEIQTCAASAEPSVPDCSGSCAPIASVGDGTCHNGHQTGANFDCEDFFHDMGDCQQPNQQTVQAALELAMGLNESAPLLDETSDAREAFEFDFVADIGRSLHVPSGSVRITAVFAVGQTEGRRRQQDRDRGSRGDRVTPPPPPVVVTMVVEFEIVLEDTVQARELVEDITVQASDPTSPLRSGNATSLVTRADTVRLDVPESWVADLNEAIVAASCEGIQLELSLTYGNVAWSLTRFLDEAPILNGATDVVDEVFCVPEGVYSMRVEPVSDLGGTCCSGDWTVKIKDTTPVLADGTDFQHRATTVFVVGNPTLLPEDCEEPPCEEEPLVGPACEDPPCDDVISMGGFTCLPLWIGTTVSENLDAVGEPQMTQVINQGCAPHPTLGPSVGVGYCKVYDLHQVANSGCDDADMGTGCGHFYWDFCEVEGGLSFLYVTATTGDPRQPAYANIDGGEFQYFLFDAFAGAPYTIFTESAGLSDTVMFLYDTDGVTEIAYNDDYDGLMSLINWVASSTGTYIVGVRGYSPSQTGGFFLNVEVEVPPNPCDPNPCMNNGVCSDLTYTFSCECAGDYVGTTCNMPNLDGVDFIEVSLCPSRGEVAVSEVGLLSSQPTAMYDNNVDCGLHIETPEGTAVVLSFTSFALEANFDYVYVYDGNSDSGTQLARLDGWDTPPTVTSLGGNHMYVRMTSDGSVADAGFEAIWTAVDPSDLPPPPPPDPCSGGVGLTGGGSIEFTGGYENGMWCQWTLTCAGTMSLEFASFQTEENFDYVTVTDGPDSSAPTLISSSGTYSGGVLSSSGSSLWIEFTSDNSVTSDGFLATYTCEDPGDPCNGGMTANPPFMIEFAGSSPGASPCLWTLSCRDRPVHIIFYSLTTGAGDAVSLYEGATVAGPQVGEDLSGSSIPEPLVSETPTVTLQATAGADFEAEFECGPEPNPCETGGNGEFQVGGDACAAGTTSLHCGSGSISSGAYTDNAACSWRVQCDGAGPATILFNSFDMEANFDFVYIGGNTLTGSSLPHPMTIESSSAIDIQLESDGSVTGQGFSIVVECPEGGGGAMPGIGGEDACNGGTELHGDNEIEFSLPAQGQGIHANCIWNMNCMNSPVLLQFEAFAAVSGSEASVFEGSTNLETLSGELPYNSVPPNSWSFTSGGNTLGLELFADGETDTSFRAMASCPNDVHAPPLPTPLDPCAGGEHLMGGGEIDFWSTGPYDNSLRCTWDINCNIGTVATIRFDSFSTESDWDFVGVDHIPMTPCSSDATDTCYSGDGPVLGQPITNGQPDMQVLFESDESVAGQGFQATVSCELGDETGRRRQQEQEPARGTTAPAPADSSVNGTRSRDLIAETNVDAFRYDADKCIAKNADSNADVAACSAIMDSWDIDTDPGGLEDACDVNTACQFLPGQQAYVFLIPLDFSEQTIELNISSLVDYMWVDQKTWTVEVRFATYNGNKKLFSIVHMKMIFDLSGQTTKLLNVDSVNLELWGTWTDYVRILLELCILIFAGMNFLTEMSELRALGFHYFSEMWNYLDILNVWLFAWSALTWMYLFFVSIGIEIPNKFDMSRPEDKTKLFTVMDTLDDSTKRFQRYIMITSINVMVCFVRFFKFVKVQERLNIVNETLAKASIDLLHFTISFMISFLCFAVMGCVMFGFKMTEFKSVTDAFHALFNMSIGDTTLWEEMRRIHPVAGTIYQYVFFLFMGFTMINIFLAIIMDSYAEVVGEARSRGAHTIFHDLQKARGVFATSHRNPFPASAIAKGTRVNYPEASHLARDPYVEDLTKKAKLREEVEFTPALLKSEARPEVMKFLHDTYSRMTEGETDPVDDLHELVHTIHVENSHRVNQLERQLRAQMAESEARILQALGASKAGDTL